jgi:hypothetical protein
MSNLKDMVDASDVARNIVSLEVPRDKKTVLMSRRPKTVNVHALLSDSYLILQTELSRLRLLSASQGLKPQETQQFLQTLKALELTAAQEQALSQSLGDKTLNSLSDEELLVFAQAAIAELTPKDGT